MNQKAKLSVLTGLNLAVNAALSVGAHAGVATDQATSYGTEPSSFRHSDVMQVNTNEFETSFLKVSASCKSSHAAFDAVSVGLENVPVEVRLIHAEIETA